MTTNKTQDVDEQLQEVKDGLRGMNLTESKERKGENDKKRAARRAIHDQLKPDSERKASNANPMATPEKSKNLKESLKPRKLSSDFPPEINDAPTTVKDMTSTATTTTEIKIDFRRGRRKPERLKKELKEAVAIKKDPAKNNFETFVEKNEMLGPLSVSVNKVKIQKCTYPQYISRKVIELSLAGQVVWETGDGKAAEGTTNFWDFNYKERKLIEAAQLYSLCKARDAPENEEKQLLPVMYWMEKKEDTTPDWRRSSRTKDGREEVSWEKPPDWATGYLNTKSILKRSERSPKDSTGQKTVKSSGGLHRRQMTDSNEDDDGDDDENVLAEDIQLFELCNKKGSEPNKHPNAVYLLLCRFNGAGVQKKYRVQAYAGKAINGVENRWLQHSRESQYLLQLYPLMTRFSALPLRVSLLVEVVVGRLYAQGGRKYITDNASADHDNIALFVYRAYGKNAKGDKLKKNTVAMEKTEGDLIKELDLTNMECGMNGTEPKDEENEAENAKIAEDGDN